MCFAPSRISIWTRPQIFPWCCWRLQPFPWWYWGCDRTISMLFSRNLEVIWSLYSNIRIGCRFGIPAPAALAHSATTIYEAGIPCKQRSMTTPPSSHHFDVFLRGPRKKAQSSLISSLLFDCRVASNDLTARLLPILHWLAECSGFRRSKLFTSMILSDSTSSCTFSRIYWISLRLFFFGERLWVGSFRGEAGFLGKCRRSWDGATYRWMTAPSSGLRLCWDCGPATTSGRLLLTSTRAGRPGRADWRPDY